MASMVTSNLPQLVGASKAVLSFLSYNLKALSTSLKIQTLRGNYLSSFNVRTKQVDFSDRDSWERNMDDLILWTAVWHDEHWFDRSGLLKPSGTTPDSKNAVKVVLLNLDRNCEYADDRLTANVADTHFSTFEGKIQAISSRNPDKRYMSVLVPFWERGSHQVVTTQTLLDGQNSR